MKILEYIFLILLVSINSLKATSGYNIVLKDSSRTIDCTTIGSSEVNGVSYSN